MEKRPNLDRNITLADFNDFYWLKEELADFCKRVGISTSGGKIEISDRIRHYILTGKTDKIEAYYYDLNNTQLINEIALDKKLEILCEKFNEIKEISKDEISFSKCEDKSSCTYCAYKIICNRE